MVYQTNRKDKNGKRLPNNVAIFVEYNAEGTEGTAVVEFENPKEPGAIGTEFGEVDFYTVDTIFEPDVERDGFDFDYSTMGLDKLRTLFYKKECYSLNQNG